MAINQVAAGSVQTFTAGTAAVSAGTIVNIGSGYYGVLLEDVAASGTGPAAITGVWEVSKDGSNLTLNLASTLTDGTAGTTVSTSTAGTAIKNFRVFEAAGTAATTVKVIITPGASS